MSAPTPPPGPFISAAFALLVLAAAGTGVWWLAGASGLPFGIAVIVGTALVLLAGLVETIHRGRSGP